MMPGFQPEINEASMLLALLAGCVPFVEFEPSQEWADHDFDGDGQTEDAGDCDDGDPAVYAGAQELCDGRDNDCDGTTDVGAADGAVWYADADGDGLGDPETWTLACEAPEGHVAGADDCGDDDPARGGMTAYWGDSDGDGFGGDAYSALSCDDLTVFALSLRSDDCDDTLAAVNPATVWHGDTDGDGFGDPFVSTVACAPGAGWSLDRSDCDDHEATITTRCAWRDLSMADYAACGVRGNGLAVCWGDDFDGALVAPSDVPFLSVELSDRPNTYEPAACGILESDRSLRCWGGAGALVLQDVPSGAFEQVSVGVAHACALTAEGLAVCWGSDLAGGVADVPSDVTFTQVLAGEQLSVGLDAEGGIHVWGNAPNFPNPGALDDATLPAICVASPFAAECDAEVVREQLGDATYVQIGLDEMRVCGLTAEGEVRCAGSASDLNRGGHAEIPAGDRQLLTIGRARTCVIEAGSGALACAGIGSSVAPAIVRAGGYTRFAASLAGYTDCALWEDGDDSGIDCWGPNDRGEGEPP